MVHVDKEEEEGIEKGVEDVSHNTCTSKMFQVFVSVISEQFVLSRVRRICALFHEIRFIDYA